MLNMRKHVCQEKQNEEQSGLSWPSEFSPCARWRQTSFMLVSLTEVVDSYNFEF